MARELSTAELRDYLKKIVEIESSVYEQETIYKKASEKNVRRNVIKKEIPKPIEEVGEKPKAPSAPAKTTGLWFAYFFIIVGGLELILGPVSGLWFVFVIGIIGLVIGIVMLAVAKKSDKDDEAKYEADKIQYSKDLEKWEKEKALLHESFLTDMEKYRKACAAQEEKYAIEDKEAEDAYQNGRAVVAQLSNALKNTQNVLKQYYDLDIIFPKYRNLVAVSSFLEYLETGRCTELAGPNGCYNLYESELRQNIIIGQLGVVITQLEQVKQNQFVLYQELQEANKGIETINRQLGRISDYARRTEVNSAITSYCAKVTAQNSAMLAGMMMYR